MTPKRIFHFEFEDESAHDRITFEYPEEGELSLRLENVGGEPYLVASKEAMLLLARTMIKMAMGQYSRTFHLHLHQDWNAEADEILTLMVDPK